jgi:protein-S-isoprenylcysteine O-methyltransferase
VRVATLLLFTAGWIVVFCYRSEEQRTKLSAASAAERLWIPLTTLVISLHVSLAQLLITLPLLGVLPAASARQRLALGLAVFAAGIAWWLWARRALGPLDRFVDTVSPPPRLLTDGPFALVRHPLALGTLVCTLGSAVAAASLATWLSFAACAVCLANRCLQDEAELWQVFGQAYRSYAARTARLVPFVW